MPNPSVVEKIKASGISIYDLSPLSDPSLWITNSQLQTFLDKSLKGLSLAGLPLRTRSKVLKSAVCEGLGYPTPASFKKTNPRFPGQNFDTYSQKSNNLQIWNEDISSERRYVVINISKNDIVNSVKVINGKELAILDTTGTLTKKYQAKVITKEATKELISKNDTPILAQLIANASQEKKVTEKECAYSENPIAPPQAKSLLTIREVFDKLSNIIGVSFVDAGIDQERNRGSHLHRIICEKLGYKYQDNGQFPDIYHQLLEIKLQTSPTIDLGLVEPVSEDFLDVNITGTQIRHCDVRYAIICGNTNGCEVTITHLFLTTGADFFTRFPRFEGKVTNQKIQIPLPKDFFFS